MLKKRRLLSYLSDETRLKLRQDRQEYIEGEEELRWKDRKRGHMHTQEHARMQAGGRGKKRDRLIVF